MLLKSRYYIPEPEVAPKVYTPDLASLISWLSDQDGATEYDAYSIHDCLLCRFFGAIAGQPSVPFYKVMTALSLADGKHPLELVANGTETTLRAKAIHTYAAALLRARNLRDGVA